MLRVGLVADDLTGAFDSAAPFAMRGLATRVLCDVGGGPSPAIARGDVLSINSASRHLAPAAAARAVERAFRVLAAREPAILLKKIDSTLRGHVAVEILAAIAAGGRRLAVITPATPSQGRLMRDGEVYVDGTPLADTPYVHDAVSRASPLPLAEQLRAADPRLPVALASTPPADPGSGRRIWIMDASSEHDLARIAAWAGARHDETLLVGAAGLAEAVAATFGPRRPISSPPPADGMILYAVGSRAPVSRRQARRLEEGQPDCAILPAPAGMIDPVAAAARLRRAPSTALIQVPPEAAACGAAQVARNLGESVAGLLDAAPVAALVVTGGDTAAAVLSRLGQPVVEVAGELRPGIPLGFIDRKGRRIALVTKAGGFGDERLFLDLPDLLPPRFS